LLEIEREAKRFVLIKTVFEALLSSLFLTCDKSWCSLEKNFIVTGNLRKFTGKNLESSTFLREFFVSDLEDNTLSSLTLEQELPYSIIKNEDETKYL
jgi:hypothetical protein